MAGHEVRAGLRVQDADLDVLTLPFDVDFFWTPSSVASLARAQAVSPATFDEPMTDLNDGERADLVDALAAPRTVA